MRVTRCSSIGSESRARAWVHENKPLLTTKIAKIAKHTNPLSVFVIFVAFVSFVVKRACWVDSCRHAVVSDARRLVWYSVSAALADVIVSSAARTDGRSVARITE